MSTKDAPDLLAVNGRKRSLLLSELTGKLGAMPSDPDEPEGDRAGRSGYRDHDHTAEHTLLRAFENPTTKNHLAAELAVALLQRRYDYVLRRLDGVTDLPEYPVHGHDPTRHPEDCAAASLEELAGAVLADRAETLGHGLEAVHALARDRDLARRIARILWARNPRPLQVEGWQLPDEVPWLEGNHDW